MFLLLSLIPSYVWGITLLLIILSKVEILSQPLTGRGLCRCSGVLHPCMLTWSTGYYWKGEHVSSRGQRVLLQWSIFSFLVWSPLWKSEQKKKNTIYIQHDLKGVESKEFSDIVYVFFLNIKEYSCCKKRKESIEWYKYENESSGSHQ